MNTNNSSIYMIIWWASVALILVIAWLLGAFSREWDPIVPNIPTNNIIDSSQSLPQSCQNVISLMNCVVDSEQLSWSQSSLNQAYKQLLSEWNVITDTNRLNNVCTTQYNYLLSIEENSYKTLIQSCLQ